MNKNLKLGIVLLAITGVTGLVLGLVHEVTLKPISAAQARQRTEAYKATLPGCDAYTPVKAVQGTPVLDIQKGTSGGKTVGYVITVSPKGYAGPIIFVVGIGEKNGTVEGIQILSQSETPGLGANADKPAFKDQYAGKPASPFTVVKTPPASANEIQAISGATITSKAVTDGVNDAVAYWSANLRGKP